jgi:large subunit ribosomal protein L4e
VGTVKLPAVFQAPVRPDVVTFVHTNIAKNARQPYAVSIKAGHQTSATSWGTGRAVARIPRVSGGGTHRAGQAAFGNMCRGGRMFAPTKTWRKWHVKLNLNQKRYATASALAATAIPSLVLARGHRIEQINEVPLVVADSIESITKAKEATALLKALNAYGDVAKVVDSKRLRAGKGKLRNRRYRQRRGPLVVVNSDNGVGKAFRNLPGVEVANVNALNLLQLAPGGHMGRFVIWSKSAFEQLDKVYGTYRHGASLKSGYKLPFSKVTNPDIGRIINSEEVQAALKPMGPAKTNRPYKQKKNPLRNRNIMFKLNPYALHARRQQALYQDKLAKGEVAKKPKKTGHASKTFLDNMLAP